jgi:predicted Holliday junction resolvase-like endonuclease
MENSLILFALFIVVLIVVAILAVVIGYFWASSTTKAELLKQLKDQGDLANKQAQEQLQNWKDQELNSIRQQIHDAAKGQAIQEMQEQVQKWQENELKQIRQQMLEGVRGEAIKEAQEQLVKWRTDELENAKSQIWGVLSKEATVSLEQWKVEVEKEIRKDAIDKSSSVTMGKMTEHMVPYLPGFGFNPADARFIGSPIDLIVFDGLGNDEVKKIVFVEIKTGASALSTRERMVRDAVLAKNVEWMEIIANLENPDVVQERRSRRRNNSA